MKALEARLSRLPGSIQPMAKTRTYKVVKNRMHFKCPLCGANRTLTVPPNVRRKNLRCHKCSETIKCLLNRRIANRDLQSGKVSMYTSDGEEFEVLLHDISKEGIGFELIAGGPRLRKLTAGKKVHFKCSWNSRLISDGKFEIKSVRGLRIGAQKA